MEFLGAVPVDDDRWAVEMSRGGRWHTVPGYALDTMARILNASPYGDREDLLCLWCDGLEDVAAEMPEWWRPHRTHSWRMISPTDDVTYSSRAEASVSGLDYITVDVHTGEEVEVVRVAESPARRKDATEAVYRTVDVVAFEKGAEAGKVSFTLPSTSLCSRRFTARGTISSRFRRLDVHAVPVDLDSTVDTPTLCDEAFAILALMRAIASPGDYDDERVVDALRQRLVQVDGQFHRSTTNDHVIAVYQIATARNLGDGAPLTL